METTSDEQKKCQTHVLNAWARTVAGSIVAAVGISSRGGWGVELNAFIVALLAIAGFVSAVRAMTAMRSTFVTLLVVPPLLVQIFLLILAVATVIRL